MDDAEALKYLSIFEGSDFLMDSLRYRKLFKASIFERFYQLPEKFVENLNSVDFMEDFRRKILDESNLNNNEIVVYSPHSKYKPIKVAVGTKSGKIYDLSNISPLVASLKASSEIQRMFVVATTKENRKKVEKIAREIINSYE
jgi:HD superfamily phosphohydrolase